MAKIKRIKLTNLFVRYTLWFIVTTLASLALAMGLYFAAEGTGFITQIPWTQTEVDGVRRSMAEQETLNSGMFPIRSDYAVFAADGDFLYGNADPAKQQWLWDQYRQRGVYSDAQGIALIKNAQVRIVMLNIEKMAFRNEWLRSLFPGPGFSAVVLFSVFFLGGVAVLAMRYGRRLASQLNAMTQATKRIQAQDLEFSVGHSDIQEVDEVLTSMSSMKVALQTALSEQWALERERGEQIAALTHDVQTPLTVIRGNAELIGHCESLAQAKEYGRYIENNASLISEYVAALDYMNGHGQEEEWPVSHLCSTLTAALKSMCATKQISVIVNGAAPKGRVRADWLSQLRAFANVFENAVRYTPDVGVITLDVEGKQGFAQFTIRDSGVGFSDEALRRATERSYTEKHDPCGHGMGLFIANTVISRLGGSLTFRNDVINGGGVVVISIPIMDPQ